MSELPADNNPTREGLLLQSLKVWVEATAKFQKDLQAYLETKESEKISECPPEIISVQTEAPDGRPIAAEVRVSNVVAIESGKSKRGRKPKGEFSLADTIVCLVQEYPEGLSLSEIVHNLLKVGYKSSSKDFAGVVASTLSSLKANGRLAKAESGKFLIPSK